MPLPAGHPPFSSFSPFHGVREAKPLFHWLECRIAVFAIFVKNTLFLAGQKHGLPKAPFSGPRKKKKQHKRRPFGPDFPRTSLTLTPGCPGVKKFLPTIGAAGKRTFRCGRPRFSARTSMTRRVVEKLCTKNVCVDFLAPNSVWRSVKGSCW